MTQSEKDTATDTLIGQPMMQALREAPGVAHVVCVVNYLDGSQKVMEANLDEAERKAKHEREAR